MEIERRFCMICEKPTKCERHIKHLLHLFFVVVFAVIFWPIAIFLVLNWLTDALTHRFNCSECGGKKTKRNVAKWQRRFEEAKA